MEDIKAVSFPLKFKFMINWTSSLVEWELSFSGQHAKILKETKKKRKNIRKFYKKFKKTRGIDITKPIVRR